MRDDLFDYFVATDEIDDFLEYEPNCPNCKNKMVKIVYGLPSSELFRKAEKGEIHLGGCDVSDVNPKYYCSSCKRSYYEDMKTYIKDSNWLEGLNE